MNNAAAFRIPIIAIDEATFTIMRVKEQFSKSFTHMQADAKNLVSPIVAVGNSLKNLADETGLTTVARHARSAMHMVGRLIGGVVRLGAELTGLAGIASFGGLLEIAKSTAEEYENLGHSAVKTGTTMEQLARIRYSAKLGADIDEGDVDKALTYLNRNIAQAASGHNKKAARVFLRYHINLHDVRGKLKDAAQVLGPLADALQKNSSAARRADDAMTLMSRSGANMLPWLVRGSQYIQATGDEFDHLHGKINESNAKIGEEAVEAWRRFGVATQGLKDSISIAVLPAITSLLGPLTEWIAKNRELIASKIGEWAGNVGRWLKSIDWKTVGKEGLEFAQAFKTVIFGLRDAINFVKDTFEWIKKNWGWIHTVLNVASLGQLDVSESMIRLAQNNAAAQAKAQGLITPQQRAYMENHPNQAVYNLPAVPVIPATVDISGKDRAEQAWSLPAMNIINDVDIGRDLPLPAAAPQIIVPRGITTSPPARLAPPAAVPVGRPITVTLPTLPDQGSNIPAATAFRHMAEVINANVLQQGKRQDRGGPHVTGTEVRTEPLRLPPIKIENLLPKIGKGIVDVRVSLDGLPKGARTKTRVSGEPIGKLDVGKSFSYI